MSTFDYDALEVSLHAILDQLQQVLTVPEHQEVREFIDVQEYGVALETLVGIIVEGHKKIPAASYSRIVEVAGLMQIQDSIDTPELRGSVC